MSATPIRIVDLGKYTDAGARVMSSRIGAREIRRAEGLDDLDETLRQDSTSFVQIVVPESVVFMGFSFLHSLLYPSARALGPKAFRDRYRIEGPHSPLYLDMLADVVASERGNK